MVERTGRERHVVGSAGQDNVRFAELDLLRRVDNALEATAAQSVYEGNRSHDQVSFASKSLGAKGRRFGSPFLVGFRTYRLTVNAGTSTGNPARWPT